MNLRILIPVALIAVGAGLYGLSGKIMTAKLAQQEKPQNEVVKPVARKVRVWTLKQDLWAGQVVIRDHLQTEMVSSEEAIKYGLTENEDGKIADVKIRFIKGMVAGSNLKAKQWVTAADFVAPDQERYIELTISENMVPYAVKVDPDTIVGGVISHGSFVDVIALSSINQNLANDQLVKDFQSISISPVLMAVRVLKVLQQEKPASKASPATTEVSLILELSRKQIARLVIAKKIAQIEIHKSIGVEQAELLQADSGDVLPTYRAIKEFRAGDAAIN